MKVKLFWFFLLLVVDASFGVVSNLLLRKHAHVIYYMFSLL